MEMAIHREDCSKYRIHYYKICHSTNIPMHLTFNHLNQKKIYEHYPVPMTVLELSQYSCQLVYYIYEYKYLESSLRSLARCAKDTAQCLRAFRICFLP